MTKKHIAITGAGTGGHVTPLRSIVEEMHKVDPECEITFIGMSGDSFAGLMNDVSGIDHRRLIQAGKWRRYPNEPLSSRILDIKTHALNIRDAFRIFCGIFQAYLILKRQKIDIVFSKGGPSAVPVGVAARLLRKKLITHDSDAIPGWTHLLIGRWAEKNLVGTASKEYPYPEELTEYVGVPISGLYGKRPSNQDTLTAKQNLGYVRKLIFVLGGSLGSKTINDAMLMIAEELDASFDVVHVVGEANYEDCKAILAQKNTKGYKVLPFISNKEVVHQHYLAADVVISRAGATNTAEIAALGKASIIIPGSQLKDQVMNSKALLAHKASIILTDEAITENPKVLLDAILEIIDHPEKASRLGDNLYSLAMPDSAQKIAKIIIDSAEAN